MSAIGSHDARYARDLALACLKDAAQTVSLGLFEFAVNVSAVFFGISPEQLDREGLIPRR
jgi:hypothetical protein